MLYHTMHNIIYAIFSASHMTIKKVTHKKQKNNNKKLIDVENYSIKQH